VTGASPTLTRDHSLQSDARTLAPWMTEEEIARCRQNVITRALGIREEVQIDLHRQATKAGDVILLCTDGLTGQVSDREVVDLIAQAGLDGSQERLDACAEALISRANAAGGRDNVTVTLAQLVDDS
jgi:serine/threonine protein phosphatase PrpC